ncbi:MAG: hypothetical protein K0Q72_5119 [Armatimonadetes bacterium]|nr:hypothetical protein [Armatimonadota bacterium]
MSTQHERACWTAPEWRYGGWRGGLIGLALAVGWGLNGRPVVPITLYFAAFTVPVGVLVGLLAVRLWAGIVRSCSALLRSQVGIMLAALLGALDGGVLCAAWASATLGHGGAVPNEYRMIVAGATVLGGCLGSIAMRSLKR